MCLLGLIIYTRICNTSTFGHSFFFYGLCYNLYVLLLYTGPPDPLQNCTIVNQTEDSLHVECSEGFDGGLPQLFFMEVYDGTTQHVRVDTVLNNLDKMGMPRDDNNHGIGNHV